jgi:hypothetical protein
MNFTISEAIGMVVAVALIATGGWMAGYMRGMYAGLGWAVFVLLLLPVFFVACTFNQGRQNPVSFDGVIVVLVPLFFVPLLVGTFLRERRGNNLDRLGDR